MPHKPPKIAYLIPNFFTASSIFSGFFSMSFAMEGLYTNAAWLILLALIFDGLDGRVARMTNTTSKFGMEFDSLADIIAFGAAPAVLIYTYIGADFGRLGIIVSALYLMFGAIRLARFNVMNTTQEPSVFIGIPIPTAAVFLSILVLLFEKYQFSSEVSITMMVVMMAVSLLMVSNIRYPSFKKMDGIKIHYMRALVLVVLSASLLVLYPIEGLALLFSLYLMYGPMRAIYTIYTRHKLMR
ncbi:MAG: CDP-diacylglycerol--serine O-phosphatidyltransferase [Campylobacterota bacterium]|nr:CDP-diacylglycerol--serine O-phosphatidyltransferase [Campylobacterota bacterium]